MITQKYVIDEIGYSATKHTILMETEQYHFGAEILTKLTVREPLRTGLTSHMPELKNRLESHFYFLEHLDNPDAKQPVYQQYFHKRLKEENVTFPSYYEVLEELICTNEKGVKQKVNVAILKENGGERIAQIEFESVGQATWFIPPDWLILLRDS